MRTLGIAALSLMLMAPLYSQESSSKTPLPAKPSSTQSSSKSSSATAPKSKLAPKTPTGRWKTYCSEEAAYCIAYPPDWDVVGDVFEGTGIVIAPPQPAKDKAMWDAITASVSDLPTPENDTGKEPPSFDEVISVALSHLPGKQVQTLQRSSMTIHNRDAELVKVQYLDPGNDKAWVEEIVFIDDQEAIYSIALRAVPEDVDGLEAAFKKVVASWRPIEAPPAVPPAPKSPANATPPVNPAPKPN